MRPAGVSRAPACRKSAPGAKAKIACGKIPPQGASSAITPACCQRCLFRMSSRSAFICCSLVRYASAWLCALASSACAFRSCRWHSRSCLRSSATSCAFPAESSRLAAAAASVLSACSLRFRPLPAVGTISPVTGSSLPISFRLGGAV